MTVEDIKEIRIQYAKLANLVFKWFSNNYNCFNVCWFHYNGRSGHA